jgi:hypothetical protein
MNVKSPETLIAALLKNELTWDDFQMAFKFFNHRERLSILEKLDEILTKGAGTERSRSTF